jgi:hypothetical protein
VILQQYSWRKVKIIHNENHSKCLPWDFMHLLHLFFSHWKHLSIPPKMSPWHGWPHLFWLYEIILLSKEKIRPETHLARGWKFYGPFLWKKFTNDHCVMHTHIIITQKQIILFIKLFARVILSLLNKIGHLQFFLLEQIPMHASQFYSYEYSRNYLINFQMHCVHVITSRTL